MGQTEYADTFIRNMLGWVRWIGNQATSAFQSGSGGGGFFPWFASNWLKILIVLVILGIVIDWVIWMVRWRPYWLWFRKKRVLLDAEHEEEDLDASDHDKLMEYGAYDNKSERAHKDSAPRFRSRALSRHDEEDEDDDLWEEDSRETAARKPFSFRREEADEEDEFDEFDEDELDPFDDLDEDVEEDEFDGFDEDDESPEDFDDEEDYDDEDYDEEDDGPGIGERFRGLLSGFKRRKEDEEDEYEDEEADEFDDIGEEDFFDEDDDEFDDFDEGETYNVGFSQKDAPSEDDFFEDETSGLSFLTSEQQEDYDEDEEDDEAVAILSQNPQDERSLYARPAPLYPDDPPRVLTFERPIDDTVDENDDNWHTGYTQKIPIIDENTPGLSRKARRKIKDAGHSDEDDE